MSNNSDLTFAPEQLRDLAQCQGLKETTSEPPPCQVHHLSARLGADQIDDMLRRYKDGESVRSLANECNVAPSAQIRLLREQNVVVLQQVVTPYQEEMIAQENRAGSSMTELERKHKPPHEAVTRELHRLGVEMRPKAPRRKSK